MSKLIKIEARLKAAGMNVEDVVAGAESVIADAIKSAREEARQETLSSLCDEMGVDLKDGQDAHASIVEAYEAKTESKDAPESSEISDLRQKAKDLGTVKQSLSHYEAGLKQAGVKLGEDEDVTTEAIAKAIENRNSTKAREILASHGLANLVDDDPETDATDPGKAKADANLSPLARIQRSIRVVD